MTDGCRRPMVRGTARMTAALIWVPTGAQITRPSETANPSRRRRDGASATTSALASPRA